jgi:hypothetical protein
MPPFLKITVLFYKGKIAVDHIPHFRYTYLEIARIAKHFRSPPRRGCGEQMQCRAELRLRQACTVDIVAVGFVDDNPVGHLHDATLDTLQFVARTRKLYEQKEIYHRMHGGLALPHADSLHEYIVVAGSLTENYSLAGFTRHTSQRPGRWGRPDKS